MASRLGVQDTLCGCWQSWPLRRTNRPDHHVSRGVSRKARRHIVKVRMPQSSRSGGGKSSPGATDAPETTSGMVCDALGFESCDIVGARALGEHQQERRGGDVCTAAVAVKIRKGGFFGVFRRPVGGADNVVHVPVGQMCVICMEPFKPNEVLEVLLCQHLYHERCIKRWLGDHTSCCVCKADMEEMAKAVRKPPRRRRSRTRAETRSERSESSRSEPGSESDQAHSTWSSVSAPAALVDRMPPDSSRLCLGAVSVLPTTVRSGRTSPPLGHGGADATSRCLRAHSPTSINPRPPLQNTNVRPPARNARCQTTMRPPAPPTAAAGSVDGGGDGDDGGRGRGGSLAGSTARLTGLRLHPSLRVSSSAIPPEWNLQSTRDSEERGSVCSSSSSCSSISINSNDEDSFSRRSTKNALNDGVGWSNSFMRPLRSPPPVRVLNRSPRRQSLSPTAIRQREITSRPRSSSSNLARSSAGGILPSPARTRGLPPPLHTASESSAAPRTSQVLPREFSPASPATANRAHELLRREFPSGVAALSTPQRLRGISQPTPSFLVESSLSSASSDQVTAKLRRQCGSSTLRRKPRSQPQPTSTRSTPARCHKWDLEPVMPEGPVSPFARKCCEPGRKVSGEKKLAVMERDRLQGGIIGARKPPGERMLRFERSVYEGGEKAASASPSTSAGHGMRIRAWREATRVMEMENEKMHSDEVMESEDRGGVVADTEPLREHSSPAMAATPADDWDPTSNSLLPAGKLYGWANTQEDDEEWLEDVDKTSTSEIGSHKTCSTQWSEMESQFSGAESQRSGNSYAGEETSAISGMPPRKRYVPAVPASPRQHVPVIAEAKCPPSSVVVSPAIHKERPEPWNCRVDPTMDTTGALASGALTPGALRVRSESAPMIWD